MSAPSIVNASPRHAQTDVVLGTQIVVSFDQPIDTSTLDSSTFSLSGPGETQVVAPAELNVNLPRADIGREYIAGTITFAADSNGNTIATFTPARPLRPNVVYTVLMVGGLNAVLGSRVKNLAGETLDSTYQWMFTSGDLDVSIPPVSSPLVPLEIPLDPARVKIQQKIWAVGNNLAQELDIIFPAPIDTRSVTPEQVLLSLEPILNDPAVAVPSGLTPAVTIEGNMIKIQISGWPAS